MLCKMKLSYAIYIMGTQQIKDISFNEVQSIKVTHEVNKRNGTTYTEVKLTVRRKQITSLLYYLQQLPEQ